MKVKQFADYVSKEISGDPRERANQKQDFVNNIKATLADQYKGSEELFSIAGVNSGKKNQKASYKGEECEVNFLPSASQKQRKALQEKAVEAFAGSYFDLQRHNSELHLEGVKNISNKRTTQEFFGKHFDAEEESLQGPAVFKALKENGISIEKKRDLFVKYIRNSARVIDNMYKEYTSDKDMVENFGKMHEAACVFGVEKPEVIFEDLTGSSLNPEGSTEITDEYKAMRAHFQDLNSYVEYNMDRIMDPSYSYFEKDDAKKFGTFLDESNLLTDALDKPKLYPHGKNAQLKDCDNMPLLDGGTAINNMDIQPMGYDAFDYNKQKNGLDKDTKYFDKNGLIDEKTAQKKMRNHEAIGFIDNEGSSKMLKCGKSGAIREVDVTGNNMDHKDEYKNMLDTLNSGTSAFNISSKEYKNMRNILGQLSKGKGNEQELLGQLKTNIDKYNENYKGKTKSPTALKRKGLVDEVAAKLEGIQDEKSISNSIIEHSHDNEKEKTNERKPLVIGALKGNSNSIKLSNEQKKEFSKSMENQMDANQRQSE